MTEASSTIAKNHRGGVIAHALTAVAAHMVEHSLPAPLDIDLPARFGFDGLTITVVSHQAEAWTRTGFIVDSFDDSKNIGTTCYRQVMATGRLIDTGVRVRIRYAASAVAQSVISAVPA